MSALSLLFVVGMGVALLVGVTAYIDYHRDETSTPIDVEADT